MARLIIQAGQLRKGWLFDAAPDVVDTSRGMRLPWFCFVDFVGIPPAEFAGMLGRNDVDGTANSILNFDALPAAQRETLATTDSVTIGNRSPELSWSEFAAAVTPTPQPPASLSTGPVRNRSTVGTSWDTLIALRSIEFLKQDEWRAAHAHVAELVRAVDEVRKRGNNRQTAAAEAAYAESIAFARQEAADREAELIAIRG